MSWRGTFLQLGVQKGPRNPRSGQGRERSLCQLLSIALRKQQAAALTVVMVRVIGTGNTYSIMDGVSGTALSTLR